MGKSKHKMPSQRKRVTGREKIGQSPGTPTFVGEQRVHEVRIDAIEYDREQIRERDDVTVANCKEFVEQPTIVWLNVAGVHDVGTVASLAEMLGWHPLTAEDIVDTAQRPKIELFPDYVFVVLKMLEYDQESSRLRVEHVSIIFGDGYVVSFLEDVGDVFDSVRARLRKESGRVRQRGADYLAYALTDAVVDEYFLVVEQVSEQLERLDDRLLADPQPADMSEIHRLKREIATLRKAAWPLRREILVIANSNSELLTDDTRVYLRDLHDNTVHVLDMADNFREILGGAHDLFLTSVSNRMNEIMKTLTIVATIFIPLTFVAGVYGMNFEHMPELKWRWGYFGVLSVMLVIGLGQLAVFRKRGWF